jgi:ATPase subunit of ABC transporter with duplicated ATPase domains
MTPPTVNYLVNITMAGRHTALAATHDRDFLEDLTRVLEPMGYQLDVTATPSPLNGKTLPI